MLLKIPAEILLVIAIFVVVLGAIALAVSLMVSNAGKFITPADKPKKRDKQENDEHPPEG